MHLLLRVSRLLQSLRLITPLLALSAAPAFAAIQATTTTVAVTAGTASPGMPQAPIVLTAKVTAAGGGQVAPGQVVFCDSTVTGCRPLGTVQLRPVPLTAGAGGTASLTIFAPPGPRKYLAVFSGTPSFGPSFSSAVASPAPTQVTSATSSLSSSGTVGNYTLSAGVYVNGTTVPSGVVSFKDTTNGAVLGTAPFGTPVSGLSLTNAGTPYTGDTGACAVVAADFNGDGIQDVAIANGCQAPGVPEDTKAAVQILLGTPSGAFKSAAAPTGFVNLIASSLATGDFNNDGVPDLIVGAGTYTNYGQNSSSTYSLVLLTGKGDGTFTSSTISSTLHADVAVAGDFNGDGNEDFAIAVSNYSDTASGFITLLFGNGAGGFTQGPSTTVGSYYSTMVAADFNKDGHPDLVLDGGQMKVLINKGDGNFTSITPPTVTNDVGQVAVGDLDGDGNQDLVAVSYGTYDVPNSGAVVVLLGDGTGNFSAPHSTPTVAYTNPDGTSVSVADINGDGLADIALFADDLAAIYISEGQGKFYAGPTVTLPNTGDPDYLPSVAGDFNGDGVVDFFGSSSDLTYGFPMITGESRSIPATLSNVSVPGTGTHAITATYAGDSYYGATTSTPVNLTAALVSTTLTLTATPATVAAGSQTALTATLSPYNAASTLTTDGETVAFSTGTKSLGTATLKNGVATLNLTNLPAGTSSVTASFPGDTNFAASNAQAVNVTVTTTASLQAQGISFGPYPVSRTEGPATETLTNTGTGTLLISSITVTGDFSTTNTCNGSVAPGATCSVSVSFTPTATGLRQGSLIINSNAAAPLSLTLAGTGTGSTASAISLSTPMLPNAQGQSYVIVSGTAVTLTATMTTPTSGTDGDTVIFRSNGVALGNATLSRGTALLQTSALPIGTDNVTVQFTGDSTYAASVSTALAFTVQAPAPVFTPAAVAFQAQVIGAAGVTSTATLTNTANAPITISGVQVTGPFTQTNTCGATLAPNGNCTFTISYVPTAVGAATGSIIVADNAQFGTATLNLTGSAVAPAAPVLSPATLSFGNQSIAVATPAQAVTLANSASGPLAITSITASGDFTQKNNCPAILAPGATCTINVVFTPSATGARTGTLTVTDNAASATQTVALTGTGFNAGAVTPPSATLPPPAAKGGTTSAIIGISAPSTYTGPVTVTCTVTFQGTGTAFDLPKCLMTPSSLTISTPGQVVTSTLSVSTTAPTASFRTALDRGQERSAAELMAAGLLLLAGFGARRRSMGRGTLLALLTLSLLSFAAGCGGGGGGSTSTSTPTGTNSDPGTTSGTYSIAVTSTAGTTTSSTSLTMTVQ